MGRIDPKQVKGGKLSGNLQIAGNLQIDSLITSANIPNETTSLTALFLSSANTFTKRLLGSMSLASITDYYTRTDTDNRYLKLTGGSLSGTLDVPNINISSAIRLSGSTGYNGQLMKSTGTGQIWAYIGWSEIWDKPNFFDGDYNSLINKPSIFNGDYNNLINKPFYIANGQINASIPSCTINSFSCEILVAGVLYVQNLNQITNLSLNTQLAVYNGNGLNYFITLSQLRTFFQSLA